MRTLKRESNEIEVLQAQVEELTKYQKRCKAALSAAKMCIFEVDVDHCLYTFFDNTEVIFGVPPAQVLESIRKFCIANAKAYHRDIIKKFAHEEDVGIMEAAFRQAKQGQRASYEARICIGEARYTWCRVELVPVKEAGRVVKVIGTMSDINDIKKRTEYLKKEASIDQFTGLYNKKSTRVLIQSIIDETEGKQHALIFFDIDNFKEVNDTYGHSEGDSLLKEVANNLQRIFRKEDIIGRFGGDEFIVFIKNLPNMKVLENKLKQLLKNDDNSYGVTKSIGVSIYPRDGEDFVELLNNADHALYVSKGAGKNRYTLYQDE